MALQVIDSPERQRYEAVREGTVLGFTAYEHMNQVLVLTHTEVDPALEGQGIGGALTRAVLDQARSRRLRVLALCPFVRVWLENHPDYHDLEYRLPASRVTD
ncbi:GNAT family N-acetyltransferase [Saccharomonospora cyanea]|uniref:Putative acetyltransferase n=1 Tax=Saccharomonospora cyanea NA-134 TaxID=882082 RepID=H5XNJ1_9PSEU|nr:GNAT family N-acetyltransferase [Saccharomonospora cyanea]EHR61052.1 putative acetyltransferase [Saccharomonospora cyanea NA-134]